MTRSRTTSRRNQAVPLSFRERARGLDRREPVPGLPDGLVCFARPISRAEMRDISAACQRPGAATGAPDAFDNDRLTMLITCASIVDDDGERLIPPGTENEFDSYAADIATALTQAALRVNGMLGAETDSAKN